MPGTAATTSAPVRPGRPHGGPGSVTSFAGASPTTPPITRVSWSAPASAPTARRRATLTLTERAGFEPAKECEPLTRLAGECLQPLGHLSFGGRGSVNEGSRATRLSGG